MTTGVLCVCLSPRPRVQGLAATTVDSFTAPSTYAVNGIKTSGANASEEHDDDSKVALPTSIVAAAVVGGMAVFGGIYYYSR